jgi:hypothetical protein
MTSVSSPLVAGIVALMRAQAPFASVEEIDIAIARTARRVPDILFGVVDAGAALRLLGNPKPRLQPVVLGAPVVGEKLEVFSGIWSGSGLAIDHRWERCRAGDCAPIAGATGPAYVPVTADVGSRLRVVASAEGVAVGVTSQTAAVALRPQSLRRPSIDGRPRVGRRLVAKRGRWQGTDLRFVVNWQRCRGECEQVATGHAYHLTAGDRGARIRIEVVAYNSLGVVDALSARTGVVR